MGFPAKVSPDRYGQKFGSHAFQEHDRKIRNLLPIESNKPYAGSSKLQFVKWNHHLNVTEPEYKILTSKVKRFDQIYASFYFCQRTSQWHYFQCSVPKRIMRKRKDVARYRIKGCIDARKRRVYASLSIFSDHSSKFGNLTSFKRSLISWPYLSLGFFSIILFYPLASKSSYRILPFSLSFQLLIFPFGYS